MEAKNNRKIYYTMGEVSEMFDVKPSLIRFWESKFDILKPHKNKKGNRLFTPQDLENFKLIYHLVKEKGMTLSGAQKRIKENREGISRDMEVIDRLLTIRSLLVEIKQELGGGSANADGTVTLEFAPQEETETAQEILLPEEVAEEPTLPTPVYTIEESSEVVPAETVEQEQANIDALWEEDGGTYGSPWDEPEDPADEPAEELTAELQEETTGILPEPKAAEMSLEPETAYLTEEIRELTEIDEPEPEYIRELDEQLRLEAQTAAEVMETLAEIDNPEPKSTSGPQIIEQTLF